MAFKMLTDLAADEVVTFEQDLATFEAAFAALRINMAEILCVRLYTGPLFEVRASSPTHCFVLSFWSSHVYHLCKS